VFERTGRVAVELAIEPLGGKRGKKDHMGHGGH
jgi:hypothetical protein